MAERIDITLHEGQVNQLVVVANELELVESSLEGFWKRHLRSDVATKFVLDLDKQVQGVQEFFRRVHANLETGSEVVLSGVLKDEAGLFPDTFDLLAVRYSLPSGLIEQKNMMYHRALLDALFDRENPFPVNIEHNPKIEFFPDNIPNAILFSLLRRREVGLKVDE